MKWLWQRRRMFCGMVGVVLVLAGLTGTYWWFYKVAPVRRTMDPQWVLSHSQLEYWQQVQAGIHRGTWLHDDGFTVGHYGDKAWAEWIINHIRPDVEMEGCSGAPLMHSATSMRYITNQDAGGNADGWLDWWQQNGQKSQVQWIAEGFRPYGFVPDVAPKPEQIEALLELLGRPDDDESPDRLDHVQYNEFRWLRDSGFEPVAFALSDYTASDRLKPGLLEYAKYQRSYPQPYYAAGEGLGILPLQDNDADLTDYTTVELMRPRYRIGANTFIFVTTAVGIGLVLWSFRKRKTPPSIHENVEA